MEMAGKRASDATALFNTFHNARFGRMAIKGTPIDTGPQKFSAAGELAAPMWFPPLKLR